MGSLYCIYGAGGHSKVIIEILENQDEKIFSLYHDGPKTISLFNYEVSNDTAIFKNASLQWIIGIGNNRVRKEIAESHRVQYGRAIDKSATISKRATVASGTVIMPGVRLNSSSHIEKHVILNTNSSVDHDCIVSDYVHISPNATLCGGVVVGEGTHIGAGAVVIPGIKIGKWCTIGAGAIIIKDVQDFSTVVGNPGRIVRTQ